MRKHSFIPFSAGKISEPTQPGHGSEIFFAPKQAPKVALVSSVAWSLWNYRLTLIQALEAAGYQVQLFAAEDAGNKHLSQSTGADFIPLKELSRRSLSPLQNLKSLLEMWRLFRKHRPDLILFFTIRPNTLGNIAAALCRIPGIATIEGMGISGTRRILRSITQSLYRLAFRHASKVIFLNHEDRNEFVRQGVVPKAKAIMIHGPGVDLHHFSPRPKPETRATTVFLFMARLLPEKGIREYVAAARILRTRGIDAAFQVLGIVDAGNPTSISEQELNAWKAEGVIQHLGFLEDVRPALAEADFMVLPSYYREGVPRSLLEAMGMEKPVITTDNVGCRDTVEEGKNGFLVAPRDAKALAEILLKAHHLPPEKRLEMGRASRKLAMQEFGDERVIPQYLSIVQQILAT